MKEKKILLTSIEEAKRFVTEASRCDFDVLMYFIIVLQLMQSPSLVY